MIPADIALLRTPGTPAGTAREDLLTDVLLVHAPRRPAGEPGGLPHGMADDADPTLRSRDSGAGLLDPVSFVGSSDIGWFLGLGHLGEGDTPAGAESVADQSPMAHVSEVRTPTLVVHSGNDRRCPVEQGQRWFVELDRRGVPAGLLLVPGEGHELTRTGRPLHRVARFEHVPNPWSRMLPVRRGRAETQVGR